MSLRITGRRQRRRARRPVRLPAGLVAVLGAVALVFGSPLGDGAPAWAVGGPASSTAPALHVHRVIASPSQIRAAEPRYVRGDHLGVFQAELATAFPRSYGGLEVSHGRYVIRTVGTAAALRRFARVHFARVMAELGTTRLALAAPTAAAPAAAPSPNLAEQDPPLGFEPSTYSWDDLVILKANILANSQLLSAGVLGAGIDVTNDVVDVTTTGGPVDSAVESLYAPEIEVSDAVADGTLDGASRTTDSAPWNGGDSIIDAAGAGCTLGFGVSDQNTGASYSLSAGHCGSHRWFNTSIASPTLNLSTFVGATTANTVLRSGIDAELISDQSSCIVWGANGARYYITGYANAPTGASIAGEGAMSGNTSGVVSVTDWSGKIGSESLANIDLTTLALTTGDSGGPVIYPTVYGPLASGSIVGSLTLTSGTTFGVVQEIDAELYDYTAMLGDQILPNLSPTGTSC